MGRHRRLLYLTMPHNHITDNTRLAASLHSYQRVSQGAVVIPATGVFLASSKSVSTYHTSFQECTADSAIELAGRNSNTFCLINQARIESNSYIVQSLDLPLTSFAVCLCIYSRCSRAGVPRSVSYRCRQPLPIWRL